MGRMGPAGAEELHLPGGATSLGDIIKDELSPALWPDPSPERAWSRDPARVRHLGGGRRVGVTVSQIWGVCVWNK